MVFAQKWPFFQLFFLGNKGQKNVKVVFLGNLGKENVFNDILEPKNAFLSYKNKKFKKSKH